MLPRRLGMSALCGSCTTQATMSPCGSMHPRWRSFATQAVQRRRASPRAWRINLPFIQSSIAPSGVSMRVWDLRKLSDVVLWADRGRATAKGRATANYRYIRLRDSMWRPGELFGHREPSPHLVYLFQAYTTSGGRTLHSR